MANSARYDGAHTLTGLLNLKKISMRGTLIRPLGTTTANYLRSLLDGLHGGLSQGPCNFYLESDRYWRNCQHEAYSDDYDATSLRNYVNVSFDIVTGDPFSYETATTTGSGSITSTGGTKTCVNAGNAKAAPVITIVVGTTGTNTLSITNSTNGDACSITGAFTSGDSIEIDCLNLTVKKNGTALMTIFDGQFPRLDVGSNSVVFAKSAGSYTSVAVAWANRYY